MHFILTPHYDGCLRPYLQELAWKWLDNYVFGGIQRIWLSGLYI